MPRPLAGTLSPGGLPERPVQGSWTAGLLAGILCIYFLTCLALPAMSQEETLDFRASLLLAIDERDVSRARQIIEEKLPLEASLVINGGDPTPLGEAVRIDDLDMVALFLRSGGDANKAGDNPLMEALRNDSINMVRLLFQTGATLTKSDMDSALRLTLRGKNALAIYRELLSQGADIQLALETSVSGRKLEATLFCLERGGDVTGLADLNVLDLNDMTPDKTREIFNLAIHDDNRKAALSYFLAIAASEDNRQLADLALDKGAQVTIEHLSRAEEQGHDNMVLFLLELMDEDLGTLIGQAENQGQEDLTKYLNGLRTQQITTVVGPIAAGLAGLFVVLVIAFFLRKNVLQSPKRLMKTIARHDHRQLEKLLANGADPNAEYRGEPLLHAATRGEDLKLARLLLRHQADVNRVAQHPSEEAGTTPLHLAARAGHLPLTEALIRADATLNTRTSDDRTPLYLAARSGHERVAHFLVERGAALDARISEQPMIVLAMMERMPEAVALLLEIGADPNAVGPTGKTVLHTAAESGNVELIGRLLDHGADLQIQDREGRTPHASAAFHRQVEAAQVLEDAGAPVAEPEGFELPPPANLPPAPSPPAASPPAPSPSASPLFETLVIPPPAAPNPATVVPAAVVPAAVAPAAVAPATVAPAAVAPAAVAPAITTPPVTPSTSIPMPTMPTATGPTAPTSSPLAPDALTIPFPGQADSNK